jgi:hypothetical protein
MEGGGGGELGGRCQVTEISLNGGSLRAGQGLQRVLHVTVMGYCVWDRSLLAMHCNFIISDNIIPNGESTCTCLCE